MKNIAFCLTILFLFNSCALDINNEKTEAHVQIPETGVYIIPIAKSVAGDSYQGFQDKDKKWSIGVKYVTETMEELEKTYNKSNLKKMGYKLLSKKKVNYQNKYPGIWIEYEDKRRQLTRYFLYVDLTTFRLSVKGNLPTFQVPAWGAMVRRSMQTVYTESALGWILDDAVTD